MSMSALRSFGIAPKKASAHELTGALVSCQTGIASPMVKMLLCHIAAVTAERDELSGRTPFQPLCPEVVGELEKAIEDQRWRVSKLEKSGIGGCMLAETKGEIRGLQYALKLCQQKVESKEGTS